MTDGGDFRNANILIVDDREANVSLLDQILTEDGYTRITTTTNALEVCALHRKNHYDLIVLDLQMPGMDGFQVMEGLKADISDDYLPVIVLTAQPALKLRALQAGARDFISKPFELIDVTTSIRNDVGSAAQRSGRVVPTHLCGTEQTSRSRARNLRRLGCSGFSNRSCGERAGHSDECRRRSPFQQTDKRRDATFTT